MDDATIVPFERFELRYAPRTWRFADDNRAAIDAHFAAKQRARPALWNGRVLAAYEHSVDGGVCRGAYLETDFASFDAWRDWGRPAAGVMDCFAASALRASDGAFLLGVMAPHTANAGQIYFPSGTPDPGDVVQGRVDLVESARRELKEETGLDADDFDPEPGWLAVIVGAAAMHVKLLRARQPATDLRRRILDHLASDAQPGTRRHPHRARSGRSRPDDAGLHIGVPLPYVAVAAIAGTAGHPLEKGVPGARVNGRLTIFHDPGMARR